MNIFEPLLCAEKHDNIKEILVDHENRLNTLDNKVSNLEKDGVEFKTNINVLLKKMDSFISTIKWGLGIFVTISLFIIGILLNK